MPDAGVSIVIPAGWLTVTPRDLDDPATLAAAARRAGVSIDQFRSILDIGATGSPEAANLVVAVSDDGTLSRLRVQAAARQAGGLPTPDEFASEIERAAGPLFDTGNLRDLQFVRDDVRAIITGNGKAAIDVRYHAEPDPGVVELTLLRRGGPPSTATMSS